jgi:DNA repair protein RecN (Recombination protein N)
MLLELAVENYAVVDRLHVRFHSGLNLLTGETGSGKSIVVGALGLLLGARASSDMIRSGEQRARVSGRFDVPSDAAFHRVLEDAGLEAEDGELLIERDILAGGKSRVYIGSRPATAALLRDLAPYLGDIHGQHDQQLLFDRDAQRDMLDEFARAGELRNKVRSRFREWRDAHTQLNDWETGEQEKLRLLDLWQFQLKEIEAAGLKPGEDLALEEERRVQANLGRLLENAGAAFSALYDSPESAFALLRISVRKLEEMGRIDSTLAEIKTSLDPALIAVQESSYALRDYVSHLEASPSRLEEVQTRLASIDRLKRKYGASVVQILRFLDETRAQIESVEAAGDRIAALRRDRDRLAKEYEAAAAELTKAREAAATKLARAAEKELAALAMAGTSLKLELTPGEWSDNGSEQVRILVAPNRGEELKPLEKIASGGEISRIALALKTCLLNRSNTPTHRTLVFDEVDTGIGGGAADGVARRLKRLSAESQLLCVTHLAQVACYADHHYCVEKVEANGRTTTRIEELSETKRRAELGRMLSGQQVTPEALQHADQMIRAAQAV